MLESSMLYYYEDIWFDLEMNLQSVRRNIIKLLEEYQFNDCFECNRLKCRCLDVESSYRSTTLSYATDTSDYELHELSMGSLYMAAPPATSLPTPEWSVSNENSNEDSNISIEELNAWIKASIPHITLSNTRVTFPVPVDILDQVNFSWPAFPASIWSDEKMKKTVEMERVICKERERDDANSVEAFFRYFSRTRTMPTNPGLFYDLNQWLY